LKGKEFYFLLNWHSPCISSGGREFKAMMRILIIEDDEEMRALLKDCLLEQGVETDSAENGSEAFRKLVKESFDLVITDVQMPGLTGLDILPGIKKLQPETSIIVMTAFGSEEVCRKSFNRGATAYLEKPIPMDRLKTMIHEMISTKDKAEEFRR